MTSIKWGPVIEKGSYAWPADQEQPEWLKDGDMLYAHWIGDDWSSRSCLVREFSGNWHQLNRIKLLADHWAYRAIEKGFVPWAGGNAEPADWDGGSYLLASGTLSGGWCDWSRNPIYEKQGCYVIGYRRKDALREPEPLRSMRERLAALEAKPDTHALVERRTRDEWLALFNLPRLLGRPVLDHFERLGLIREPTKAERVAEKIGVDVATVQRILDALDD